MLNALKDWKTSLAGIATAFFGFVLFSPEHFPVWAVDLAKYAMLGGLASMGVLARDWRNKG